MIRIHETLTIAS